MTTTLRDRAHNHEAEALKALHQPAGTASARAGVRRALAHLRLAAAYHAAANVSQEQDQK